MESSSAGQELFQVSGVSLRPAVDMSTLLLIMTMMKSPHTLLRFALMWWCGEIWKLLYARPCDIRCYKCLVTVAVWFGNLEWCARTNSFLRKTGYYEENARQGKAREPHRFIKSVFVDVNFFSAANCRNTYISAASVLVYGAVFAFLCFPVMGNCKEDMYHNDCHFMVSIMTLPASKALEIPLYRRCKLSRGSTSKLIQWAHSRSAVLSPLWPRGSWVGVIAFRLPLLTLQLRRAQMYGQLN